MGGRISSGKGYETLNMSRYGLIRLPDYSDDYKTLILLDISYNHISDLEPLVLMRDAEVIIANDNRLQDISHIKNLKKIKTLNLANNKISDLTPLECLYSLERLDLSGNHILDFSPLSKLTNLRYLKIDKNPCETSIVLRSIYRNRIILLLLNVYTNSKRQKIPITTNFFNSILFEKHLIPMIVNFLDDTVGRFPFGRYKGETYRNIFDEDHGYFLWAMANISDSGVRGELKRIYDELAKIKTS